MFAKCKTVSEENKMEIGIKIKQLRFKAGLTQEQLAEKLGIGAQSVSKWENSLTMPDITALTFSGITITF